MRADRVSLAEVTGVVLCGGGGRRLGGADKPLLEDGTDTLLAGVLARMGATIPHWILSANRNLERYRAFGHPVVTDRVPDGGPLAGIDAAAQIARSRWLYVLAGDAPAPDAALPGQLLRASAEAPAAFALGPGGPSPLPLLVRRDQALGLAANLASGLRRVGDWLESLGAIVVPVRASEDNWINVNTPADLDAWRERRGAP